MGKVVFASTGQVAGGYGPDERVTPDMMVRPTSTYACTKAFGEALARYYADRHGMSMICLRIGWHDHGNGGRRSEQADLDRIWSEPADSELVVKVRSRATSPCRRLRRLGQSRSQLGHRGRPTAAGLRAAERSARVRPSREHLEPRRRPSVAVDPFPFIVGVARSGTTLLRAVVDAHPEIAIPPESRFIPTFAPSAIGTRQRRGVVRTCWSVT